MSLNTAHVEDGVLIYFGEFILSFTKKVEIQFTDQHSPEFRGKKQGCLYLTTHRLIFLSKHPRDLMRSFSFPFVALSEVRIGQPMLGPNYLYGKVRSQPQGNWAGEAGFKIVFKKGGAIEFGTVMARAATLAKRVAQFGNSLPAYEPPASPWHQAPPPAYSADPNAYGNYMPTGNAFENAPPNSVYMTDAPPPYPGLEGARNQQQQQEQPPPPYQQYGNPYGRYP